MTVCAFAVSISSVSLTAVDGKNVSGSAAAVMEKERRAAGQTAFGDRMHALRHRLGISQDELAPRSGLHRTYIDAVERGERNISLCGVVRIAEMLEVAPPALLEGSEAVGQVMGCHGRGDAAVGLVRGDGGACAPGTWIDARWGQ